MLRTNHLIKHVTEGDIEGKRRRERRRKQLLGKLGGWKGRHWNLKKKAPDCTLWRTRFGGGYRLVAMLRSARMILILSRKTRKAKFQLRPSDNEQKKKRMKSCGKMQTHIRQWSVNSIMLV